MNKEVRKNKDIIQSYILTVARYDSNVYAKRILTHIVNANQDYLQGEKLGGMVINIEEDLFKDRDYTMNIKNILQGDDDKNYKRIINAFYSLQGKFIRFDDEDDNHISVPFIERVVIKRHSGVAKFRMSELVYKAFSDFTRGFRKLEFELTLSFSSIYSIRFYELLSGQKTPVTYTIEEIKRWFKIEDKYTNKPTNFIKRVIEPAKKELDEKSPYSFEYAINKRGKEFYSITFYPVAIPKNRDEQVEEKNLQKQVNLSYYLERAERDYLHQKVGFTDKQIRNNFQTFVEAKKILPDFMFEVSILAGKMRGKKNPQGWFINALKGKIKDALNRL